MLYSIYTLSNPVTDEIFYVGCTTDVRKRMLQHKYSAIRQKGKSGEKLCNKDLYILQLMKDPICHLVEEVEGDYEYALSRENFYIVLMLEFGFPLVNMVSNKSLTEPATIMEIVSALRAIQIIHPNKVAA